MKGSELLCIDKRRFCTKQEGDEDDDDDDEDFVFF